MNDKHDYESSIFFVVTSEDTKDGKQKRLRIWTSMRHNKDDETPPLSHTRDMTFSFIRHNKDIAEPMRRTSQTVPKK